VNIGNLVSNRIFSFLGDAGIRVELVDQSLRFENGRWRIACQEVRNRDAHIREVKDLGHSLLPLVDESVLSHRNQTMSLCYLLIQLRVK